jgi:ornithine cyclodeaminase
VQAAAHLEALLAVRAFDAVRVYAPTADHVRALIEGASAGAASAPASAAPAAPRASAAPAAAPASAAPAAPAAPDPPAPEIEAAASAEAAVRGADVVITVTSSREPVLRRDWLGPGTHVNAVGASTPAWRELDVETVATAALFADSRESLRNEAGEYRLALEQGAISGDEHVRAELGEVLAGTAPGRADDTELTLFRSLGLAVEDLAAAQVAVAGARRLGLGTEVEL